MKKLIVLTASRLFPGRSPMKITRRFAVATLLVIAVAIVLGAPAPAFANGHKAQVKLYPAAGGPFPNASGQVSLSMDLYSFSGALNSVAVSKLAPNTSYFMPLYIQVWNGTYWQFEPYLISFQTDAHGAYKSGCGRIVSTLYGFEVYDSATGTLVLTSNP